MISSLILILVLHLTQSIFIPKSYNQQNNMLFKDDQIIFSTNHVITKILVPVDGRFIQSNDIPSIFFTVSDPRLEGGSCVYVLEGFAAYEILEGGRDSTSDYGPDKTVYFGAKDGIYKYDAETLSAKRYGVFTDDIIQLQKLKDSESFYILTANKKIYKIESEGRIKTSISSIDCATEFVLDTSDNLYYLSCYDNLPHIFLSNGSIIDTTIRSAEIFDIKLMRPAFVMNNCVPFFGDEFLYILYSNGSHVKKDFFMREKPSAFSVDAALYLVAAYKGKMYEFNVMEVLFKSLFGLVHTSKVSKMVLSLMETPSSGYSL